MTRAIPILQSRICRYCSDGAKRWCCIALTATRSLTGQLRWNVKLAQAVLHLRFTCVTDLVRHGSCVCRVCQGCSQMPTTEQARDQRWPQANRRRGCRAAAGNLHSECFILLAVTDLIPSVHSDASHFGAWNAVHMSFEVHT